MFIREISHADQPQYRFEKHGSTALSDAELLALLLRRGKGEENTLQLAHRLLNTHGGWAGLLRVDNATLHQEIGESKATVIKVALDVARRLLVAGVEDRTQIKSPADVAALLMVEMGHLDQEHLRTVLLDTKNRVIAIHTVYIGSVNSASVRVGEIYKDTAGELGLLSPPATSMEYVFAFRQDGLPFFLG
ncbi:MAG: hypothetical protein HC822_14245 [Oscillochloris sp.]|nr:hypothetical protein [Oscillochloris sp.]